MWCRHGRGHFVRSFVGEEFADEMIKLDKKFDKPVVLILTHE